IYVETRLRHVHGRLDFVEEPLFHFSRCVDFWAAQERIVSGNKLALERSHFEHLAELKALGDMIMQVRGISRRRYSLFQLGDSLVVLKVIKVIECGIERRPDILLGKQCQRGKEPESDKPHAISV